MSGLVDVEQQAAEVEVCRREVHVHIERLAISAEGFVRAACVVVGEAKVVPSLCVARQQHGGLRQRRDGLVEFTLL